MSSNRSVTYYLYLNSNVRFALQQTEQAALRLDSQMSSLNSTLATIGASLGTYHIIRAGKEWVNLAADYEQSVLRIRNNSETLFEGLKNVEFIRNEVDKFKIPLMEATETYGDFLAMVKGSHLGAEEVRKLHDEILTITKIKGIGQGQMDAAVRNLGKMLEVGALDARHFFFFEQQLSGIGAYVAKEMGISLNELAKMRKRGDLTNVEPTVLLRAIEKMAADEGTKLPEMLQSIRSEVNELDTAWIQAKVNLVDELKPELVDLVNLLTDGAKWFDNNKQSVIDFGNAALKVAGFFIAYKAGTIGLNLALSGYRAVQSILIGQTITQTSLTSKQTLAYTQQVGAINAVTAAIERMNFVQNASNASFITNSAGVTMANTAANRYAMSAGASSAASSTASAAAGSAAAYSLAGALNNLILKVGLVWIAGSVLEALGVFGQTDTGHKNTFLDTLGVSDWNRSQEALFTNRTGLLSRGFEIWEDRLKVFNENQIEFEKQRQRALAGQIVELKFDLEGKIIPYGSTKYYSNEREGTQDLPNVNVSIDERLKHIDNVFQANQIGKYNPATDKKKIPTTDTTNKIRGNSVTNINLNIGEMIGMKNPNFAVKNIKDMDKITETTGSAIVRALASAVNDSQIVKGNR